MKDTLGVLLAGGAGERLYPLTRDRAKPAVTFGGIYRIIDVTLSNCINSDLRKVHILTQYKALSLNRHIREGWSNLVSRHLGEFFEILFVVDEEGVFHLETCVLALHGFSFTWFLLADRLVASLALAIILARSPANKVSEPLPEL